MEHVVKELDDLIQSKVEAGIFASPEAALEAIRVWLDQMEKDFFEAQMRSEDA